MIYVWSLSLSLFLLSLYRIKSVLLLCSFCSWGFELSERETKEKREKKRPIIGFQTPCQVCASFFSFHCILCLTFLGDISINGVILLIWDFVSLCCAYCYFREKLLFLFSLAGFSAKAIWIVGTIEWYIKGRLSNLFFHLINTDMHKIWELFLHFVWFKFLLSFWFRTRGLWGPCCLDLLESILNLLISGVLFIYFLSFFFECFECIFSLWRFSFCIVSKYDYFWIFQFLSFSFLI